MPSLRVLYEEYAANGRIDESAPVTGESVVEIDALASTVWRLLTEMRDWPAWAPGHERYLGMLKAAAESR
ncbi:hypothetical protein [Thermoactinospora rubra]|uniref:hypothetical protein n=1 Tax=Thermoactinospora rubra TaxID=1088767 RepID=UPI0011802164|nr:hypothetical protein [Thermoactinospora rubra]